MDFRIGRTVVSPSSSSSSGLLYPPAPPHSLTPTPIFYYPGLPLKIPPSPHSSPLVPPSGLNGNYHRSTSCTTSSLMMRSTATVQPSALHPPVPQSSPHLHRVPPGSVVSPPSSGTSARHQHNGGSSNNSNSSSSSSNSSSSSFAAALRHLAKQAGGPTQSTIHSDQEAESSPNRSSYGGGTHGYAHTYNGDTVSKSPSPSFHYRSTPKRDSGHTKSRRDDHPIVTTRSRSPPVVTIAPTLSLSNMQYQDPRKAYDRAMLCHTVPSSGGFNGGLSTGLAGLHGLPPMVGNASPFTAPPMMATSSSPASSNNDYARTSEIPGFSHPMPPYTPFPTSRPDDLFYGGLRSSMQQSASAAATSHFRPEENRSVPMSINNSYHESLLSQLPASRAPSTILSQNQEDYLLAARNSGFNPYAIASSGPLDHSSLHPSMYSHPFASYRSLEEQLYMERYGLLRPGTSSSALSSAIPPYPSLGFPSYLNFRYPSPNLLHPDLGLMNNGMDINRMKLEEEQRVKERIREEEFAAAAASKSQENVVSNRPLATVTPRENNTTNQDRRERERQREKRRSEKDNESNRNATVQLPNESSSDRGVKVHTVSPLYASYPVIAESCSNTAEVSAAPEASISPNPPTEEEKRTTEFSRDALEAMAALKQRTLSPAPPEEEPTKLEEEVTVPLDLSDTSVGSISPLKVNNVEICHAKSQSEESPVRSLLDIRVERWNRKRQSSDPGEEEIDDDLEDEMGLETSDSLASMSVEQCLKNYPVPAGVSEEQHNFLHMFGLITPKKRSEFELVKCIRRQNILREPTPPPIDTEDEDSGTSLLRQRTRFAATLVRPIVEPQVKDPATRNFAANLHLYPTDSQTAESVEKSWSMVVADRMKRHFGQKQNVRKRLWSDTFRPQHFDSIPPPMNGKTNDHTIDKTIGDTGEIKSVPTLPLQPPTTLSKPLISVANLAKLELSDADCKTTERSNEVSKLTSEVAFWLRHLKPTMARTLTSSSIKENTSDSTKSDEGSSLAENSDGEFPTRWPGTDSIMVLYMAHQQDLLVETKFLREHCERLHVQLAEGQATLSKLCLALSSSVEVQRRCKEEDTSTLQSINDLQSTLKMLQSP
ncbi:hypothetical protein GHT06_015074 [Daphnia sinensis]|uniref:Genetic suppressor element-like domain-containing protein n=1 Tax=Daphnia sinensis TaxID=1820382 RepID=A0AAD5KQR8_9CRUS|nr:hypothetical protein GHT06_015074 [Daphnia sinensis]